MKIEPDVFDLIVVGTGLQESLVASAAALSGKTVLQLDGEKYYGDAWAGLNLNEFIERVSVIRESADVKLDEAGSDGGGHVIMGVPCVYHGMDIVRRDDDALGSPGEYIIDLAPKVTYQAGPMLDTLVQTNAHNYVDYRLIEASFILSNNHLLKIPASRSDIFKDDHLTSKQKRTLTEFLKNAVELLESSMSQPDQLPDFDEWMATHELDDALSEMIHSGVCFTREHTTSAEKFKALGLYLHSAGRLKPQSCPFIVPFYSSSDVPQAFCRLCAVHGGIYVLQCHIQSIRYAADHIIEVITQYNQTIQCSRLCLPSSYLTVLPSLHSQLPVPLREETISRMVCVLHRTIQDDIHQSLIVMPRGDHPPVYFLQVGTPSCPRGRYVLYGWCRSISMDAKSDFSDALDVLMTSTATPSTPLFECYYQQKLPESPGGIVPHLVFASGPSGMIGHTQDIQSAAAAFHWLYPNEIFLKRPPMDAGEHEDSDDDMFAALENELSQSDAHASANGM